jgi:hypothetical protein
MALNVEVPAPPELEETDPNEYEDADIVGETDYRRQEIAEFLGDGAWQRAFEDWTRHTDLNEEEFDVVTDLGLLRQFDFFWDSYAERVGYHAPGIPEDWKERDYHDDIDSWATASNINASLTELGQTVCEVLKSEYIDWEGDYESPDDLPEF